MIYCTKCGKEVINGSHKCAGNMGKESTHKDFSDPVNHPDYYNQGIEVIKFINSHNLNFNRGSVVKYAVRAGKKNPEKEIEDLKKAIFYLESEIGRIEGDIK